MLHTKGLRPSSREKKRYIVYEVDTDLPKAQYKLKQEIERMLGIFMSASAGILPVVHVGRRGILRVNNKMTDYVKACFAIIDSIDGTPAKVHSILTSGTLKKARLQLEEKNATNVTSSNGI